MRHVVHIYDNDEDKEDLLLDCIRPVMEELRRMPGVERVLVRLDELHGSHVQLLIDADAEYFRWKVLPDLRRELEAYLVQARTRKKSGSGLNEPLHPADMIAVLPFRTRQETPQEERIQALFEEYGVRTLDIVFDAVERTRRQMVPRVRLLVQWLAQLAVLYPVGGREGGHLAYAAEAEAYLHGLNEQRSGAQMFFERNDQALGSMMEQALTELLEATERDGRYRGPDPLLRAWSELAASMYRELAAVSTEQAAGARELEAYRMVQAHFDHHLPLLGLKPHFKYLLSHLTSQGMQRVRSALPC